ncbi:restriction endonuclease subunit S [Mycoplasma sp. NEAQ87857]|uniref:restriction endonuclease subunit S n=1 Tax=Mycoplasma sp. NEAQ87857 TaxID=2683967 RepID=UPI0013185CB3|nr:restriction endonuclease subunit S [Mycoplasma sp. NEAQ87857]QGZ97420.1 restriction endonuclease subunit S [Mycoplasma sp. NEAQ87857]
MNYQQPAKYLVGKDPKYNNKYKTPVLTAGKSFVLGYTNQTEGIYNANINNPVIIFDDFTCDNKWVDFDFKIKSSAIKILKPFDENIINLKFVYYWMQVNINQTSNHKRHWIQDTSSKLITLTSLSIQNKIVDFLDNFEQTIIDLNIKLLKEVELINK